MKKKMNPKWLWAGVLVLVVIVAGIIYTRASSDITAPVTTATVTGDKEIAPFADWYKDQAVVTLSATDPGDGGGEVPQISKAAGAPDLSATYQEAQPGTQTFSDNFDGGFNSNIWDYSTNGDANYSVNNGVLDTTVNGVNSSIFFYSDPSYYVDLNNNPKPIFLETDLTINELDIANGRISFGLESGGSDNSKALQFSIDFSQNGNGRVMYNIMDGGSEVHEFLTTYPISIGQTIRLRLEINDQSQVRFMVDTDMDGTSNSSSLWTSFTPWSGLSRVSFGVRNDNQNNKIITSWDNINSNLLVSSSGTSAGYLFSATGLSVNGIDYNEPYPFVDGSPAGVLVWGNEGPKPLPAVLPIPQPLPDLYAYLTTLTIPAGAMGNPDPLVFHWTWYSMGPDTFASIMMQLQSFGFDIVTDAFAKVYTGSGSNYISATLPVSTEGSIIIQNSVPVIIPPTTTGPVVSGVDKTYYRIGDTGSFSEYTSPVTVNTLGVNNFYYYSTDNAGNREENKMLVIKIDKDSDGDGIYDNFDNCSNMNGKPEFQGCPAAISIKGYLHIVYSGKTSGYAGTDSNGKQKNSSKIAMIPGPVGDSRGEIINSVTAKVFSYEKVKAKFGSPKNDFDKDYESSYKNSCADIYDQVTTTYKKDIKVTPVTQAQLDSSPDLVGVSAKDKYIVAERVEIADPIDGLTRIATVCRKISSPDKFNFDYNGDKISDPVAQVKTTVLKAIKDNCVKNNPSKICIQINPADEDEYTGSLLSVVYPQNVSWEEGVQNYIYPYIFTSDSDWSADVCASVPNGYKVVGAYDENGQLVSTSSCMQTFIANTSKIVAFEVSDIGSPKEFNVDSTLKLNHQGKIKTVKMTSATKKKTKEQMGTKTTQTASTSEKKQTKTKSINLKDIFKSK
ncbi:MAG TPA: hypothetical protein P5096_03640 [Patescibacteria group bacterium]|nr:hypothetical protein [Patescibacteria group bacterium]